MQFRLVRAFNGRFVEQQFDSLGSFLAHMEAMGYVPTGANMNHRQRAELQGQPVFANLTGPMWDGDAIRYENSEANDHLSV